MLGVVYDGPPEAGKTTSVRALAKSFGREVFTPEEQDGRTVYFDWLEHTGGRFDGAPIRCQIMSVPGQQRWSQRRTHLLARADVIVFVGDTSRGSWPLTVARLRELRAWLDAREGPTVGVVFQANRRDAPDAVPLAEIRERVGSERVALVESVAVDGSGVREAFVFAVRLALDRVREEQRLGTLPSVGERLQGSELLQQLLSLEQATPASGAQHAAPATELLAVTESTDSSFVLPRLPNHEVPSGLVWPPVEGRILLRDAVTGPIEGQLTESGGYEAVLPSGFRASSPAAASFADLDDGKRMLVNWARFHSSAQGLLSKGRCIVLAGTADGRYRLWQILRAEPSLRELFLDGCETVLPRHAARQLATAIRLFADAQTKCAAGDMPLECTLDTIGASELGEAIYVADMSFMTAPRPAIGTEEVAAELAAALRHRSAEERSEVGRTILLLQRREPRSEPSERIGTLVSQLLSSEPPERALFDQ